MRPIPFTVDLGVIVAIAFLILVLAGLLALAVLLAWLTRD